MIFIYIISSRLYIDLYPMITTMNKVISVIYSVKLLWHTHLTRMMGETFILMLTQSGLSIQVKVIPK